MKSDCRSAFALFAFVVLVEVAHAADDDWAAGQRRVAACYEAVDALPVFAPLNEKLPAGVPTPAQLADQQFPTQHEAELVRTLIKHYEKCSGMNMAEMQKHHPVAMPIVKLYHETARAVYALLIERRITFGNANRLLDESAVDYDHRWADYEVAAGSGHKERLEGVGGEAQADLQSLQARRWATLQGPVRCRWEKSGRLDLICEPYTGQ